MTSCAFDGRLLATDSLSHHNAQTTARPFSKMAFHETGGASYVLTGAGSAALIERIARHTFGCLKPENADLAAILGGYVGEGSVDVGLIQFGWTTDDGTLIEPKCWVAECGIWHLSATKTAAWGNNWEWAVCRMVTAGDDAGQAVRSVINHHYGARGPICVLDCLTGARHMR